MTVASQRAHEALDRLLLAHEGYFDVERDHAFAGRTFDGYAEFHSSTSQYVLVKRAKLWEAHSHEYLFFTLADHLDEAAYDDLVAFMKDEALAKVTLEPELHELVSLPRHHRRFRRRAYCAARAQDAVPQELLPWPEGMG